MTMNLSGDLQRLAPFIAVAVLALAGLFVVTRGLGGGGGGAPDANQLVQRAFATSPKSGVMDVRSTVAMELATPGGREARSESQSITGPFVEPESEDGLGQSDVTVREVKDGATTTARALSNGEQGFAQVGGQWYELNGDQAKRVFNDEQTGKHEPLLESIDLDVRKWTTNPRVDGSAQVGGVDTRRVVGDLNVAAMLGDLDLSAEADQLTQSGAKQGEVELFVGKDDGQLRKASVRGETTIQGPGGTARINIRFDVAFNELNQPQRITAPKNALPSRRLTSLSNAQLGPLADELRPAKRSNGNGSRSGGAREQRRERSGKAYVNCVSQAQNQAALEKCQSLVPQR